MIRPFDDATRRNIAKLCAAFARLPAGEAAPALKRAAVAIALVAAGDASGANASGATALLLTRRAADLRAHGSQWALPGGRCDAGETPAQAALRELHEEVGLGLAPDAVLGLLDDYPTRSGYVITPVVIWGGGRLDPQPAPDEVVAVYRVGLHQLQRADSPRFIAIPESPRPVVQIPLGNDLIHAPTGAVLLQLRWLCLEGRHDAVDELEQPMFAWK
jgi:8-oxo-dGTP pyrophosphatase MutT (NUDIX family)